jgi:uncharacterized protein
MKLHLEASAENRIRAYGPQGVRINDKTYDVSLIVTPTDVLLGALPERFDQFSATQLETLIEICPEVLILGTGKTLQFLNRDFLSRLYEHNIGTEIMTTDAACRTYNVLAAEGRKVAAALFKL